MDAHAIGKRPGYHFKPNDHLRHYRKMRHWTQTNLADELYQLCELEESERGIINANMIGGWERGEHQPSFFWQKKLCQVFSLLP
jgi:transcriptional regulator with XRE-family HTH domain